MGCKQVNQSVFTVCPPEMRIKPSMVFVFELFILKKDGTPFDRPLAWGVFPMLNSGADASCYVGERGGERGGERESEREREVERERERECVCVCVCE